MNGRMVAFSAFTVFVLASVSVAAEPWLHAGYDPAHTGGIPYNGPDTDDVALAVQFPGAAVWQPLVADGHAYVITTPATNLRDDLTERALWSLDLATGEKERLIDLPDDTNRYAIAPTLDLILMQDLESFEFVALEIPSGEELWRARPDLDGFGATWAMFAPVFVHDVVYIPMIISDQVEFPTPQGTGSLGAFTTAGVVALNRETGDVLEQWRRPVAPDEDGPTAPATHTQERVPSRVELTVRDGRVFAYMLLGARAQEGPLFAREVLYELWALDAQSLGTEWHVKDTPHYTASAGVLGQQYPEAHGSITGGRSVAGPDHVYIRLDEVTALNPANGEEVWTAGAGLADQVHVRGHTGMGLRDDVLVGTSQQMVYRIDIQSGDILWQRSIEDRERIYSSGSAVIDETDVYVLTTANFEDFGIETRDIQTGELLWQWNYTHDVDIRGHWSPAFGEGYLVWGAWDGMVHVVGSTPAAPRPAVDPSTRVPGVGEEVRVDLSASSAGAQGPVTRYRADWGDGAVTEWTSSPTLSHRYGAAGESTARFIVGTEEGQTGSAFVTFDVGGTEPNLVERIFARDNQDMTFGVLGLLVALTGGVVGVTHQHRKRSRLQQELQTLEEGFEQTKENPGECEAFLDTRKARARSLMMEGDLKEEHFSVVDARIADLRRGLRTSQLDQRLQFLPYGMVQSLKRMLADGEISTWERKTFEDLLEQDETLNEAQRERVRGMIERWSGPGQPGEEGGGAV